MKKGRVMNCLISVLLVILTLFTSVSMVYAEEEEASQDQELQITLKRNEGVAKSSD